MSYDVDVISNSLYRSLERAAEEHWPDNPFAFEFEGLFSSWGEVCWCWFSRKEEYKTRSEEAEVAEA